ncbi:TniQ family protein [Hymenobacter yonginensis]|uniref:TniQ family protein n=1 Tax=Hymenobacter yonginensis TaxID=748197 RepID=A0ABY7PLN9_9BACT|nr:TniQ family protein [Hymenobacter yonginensis]WBO83619.1 TniQ family protein [Hymenobacter yonginensis]
MTPILSPDALLERRILPCTFHPSEDELLSSWLVRLAQAHRVKVQLFSHYLWPQIVVWKRDIDKLAPPHMLNTLVVRTLTDPHRIAQTMLAPAVERLTGTQLLHVKRGPTSWLMPVGIVHRTRQGNGLVYCPGCLQRDGANPYYRTSWRLAFYVVCPTCGVYLREECPACGAPVNFFRLDMGHQNAAEQLLSTCYKCAFDLSQAPMQPVPAQELSRYYTLYRVSREGWKEAVPYPHQYFRVLRQIVRVLSCPFGEALRLQVDVRLRMGQPVTWPSGGGAFEQLPIARRIYLLEQAMWLLEDWPARFIRVMHDNQIKSYTIRRDMAEEMPFWFSSVLVEHFFSARNRSWSQFEH